MGGDRPRIRKDIEQAKQDDAAYTGGLIKTLVAVRLEVLKTNEALVEQQIDPPHLPRGAVPQAWGVAEVLRVWRQLDV